MVALVSKQAGVTNQTQNYGVSKKTVYNSWQKRSFEKQNSLCAMVSVISLKVGIRIFDNTIPMPEGWYESDAWKICNADL